MSNTFKNRVFGCAVIKSINSNYNADFSHQPRTLPNGTAYATDKVLKYSVRNYWKKMFPEETVFYFKTLNEKMEPHTLGETYEKHFGKFNKKRKDALKNLLSCLDVRLFGGTFAEKKANISIHGTCQITHGINKYKDSVIYSEQIMSPFKNSKSKDSTMTTLGTQSKLEEGHYVHHFSINPQNIAAHAERVESDGLQSEDITKLKEALRRGVTYYDSSAKAGTENELLLWVQLKEGSKVVLPSLVDLVEINEDKAIDLQKVKNLLTKEHIQSEIEAIEIYYQKGLTTVVNAPENATTYEI